MSILNPLDLKVPVQTVTEEGESKTVLEDFNPTGKQSDGSRYFIPRPLVEDHEHYMELKHPGSRFAECTYPGCGFGGHVYPHNAELRGGHVYTLKGEKVV